MLLINLLKNFENCLEKFQNIFHAGQQQPEHENDEDNWLDVNDEDVALADTQRRRPDCDYVAADVEPPKVNLRNRRIVRPVDCFRFVF